MTNSPEYSDNDYIALGHFLRREMYGVELNEDETILATMSVLKFDFNRIEIPEVENESQRIEVDGKWGFISKEGWIAFPIYDCIGRFQEGFAIVKHGKHRWSHINAKGELLADKWYDDVWNFHEGFAVVRQGDKFNHINTKGELLADKWHDGVGHFEDGVAEISVDYTNGIVSYIKYGYIDKKGNLLFPPSSEQKSREYAQSLLSKGQLTQ
jgi:hypothetical protein